MAGGGAARRRWLNGWPTCVYTILITLSCSPSAGALLRRGGNSTDTYDCYVAPAVPGDRRTNKTRLRVVTYNAEWLFLDQGRLCPGPDCPWSNEAMARQHADALADVLRDLDADVINLCEVQGCDELHYLQESLSGLGYVSYLLKGGDGATGQNVGLLTRVDPSTDLARSHATAPYPMPGSTCTAPSPSSPSSLSSSSLREGHRHRRHRPPPPPEEQEEEEGERGKGNGSPKRQPGDTHTQGGSGESPSKRQRQSGHTQGQGGKHGCSKHYYTTLLLPLIQPPTGTEKAGTQGGVLKLGLVGAHLLARPQDPSRCEQREAQASVLRGVIDTLHNDGHEVLLLGDLNDLDSEVLDINSHLPTSHVLSLLKYGQPQPFHPHTQPPNLLRAQRPLPANGAGNGSGVVLWNAVAAVTPQDARYTDWWDANGDCSVQRSELSLIDHILVSPGLRQRLANVSIDNCAYRQFCGTNESDHWPVVIDLDLTDTIMAMGPLPLAQPLPLVQPLGGQQGPGTAATAPVKTPVQHLGRSRRAV